MACTSVCPVHAVTGSEIDPYAIVGKARQLGRQGNTRLHVACSASADAEQADIEVACHGVWDAFLLASIAAEGIRDMHITGIDRCGTCPRRYGSDIFSGTENDYKTLNMALEVRLNIRHDAPPEVPRPEPKEERPGLSEPSRRAFFRNIIPSIAQGMAMTAAQIGQAAREELAEEAPPNEKESTLPLRHRLFLKALPRLKPNFTPVPDLPSLPMGAIQANDSCTACNECVEQCPTQALSLKPFGANAVLEFRPDACIGCRQCIERCPEDALEALPGISLPAIAAQRSRPLIMVPVKNGASTPPQQSIS